MPRTRSSVAPIGSSTCGEDDSIDRRSPPASAQEGQSGQGEPGSHRNGQPSAARIAGSRRASPRVAVLSARSLLAPDQDPAERRVDRTDEQRGPERLLSDKCARKDSRSHVQS